MEMPPLLTTSLVSAVGEVFEMMIGKSVEALEPDTRQPRTAWPAHVAAAVSFAGHRKGLVCIHTSLDTAKGIAGAMLGMDASEVNGEMPDAMGEVANLVAGAFRTKLAAAEPASAIAIPCVTIGSDFQTRYGSDTTRVLCPFKMEGEDLYLELLLMEP